MTAVGVYAPRTSNDRQPSRGSGWAIQLESLTKRYGRGDSSILAVDDVTLRVEPGQVIGLLGPNGAGKTTIIKMIGGLIPPTTGAIPLRRGDTRPPAPAHARPA